MKTGIGAPGRGRLAALDGLRCVAALMVVMYHYVGRDQAWDAAPSEVFPALYLPASYGWLGVQLFFLISGFVICMSAMGRGVADFFTARVVRLFPAYWVAVLATTAVVAVWPAVRHARSPSNVLLNLTMLQEPLGIAHVDGVYWTLWVELRFYLLFAIVVWLGATYRRVVAFCALWTAASVIAMAADSDLLRAVVMPQYAPYFIAGIAFFLIHRYGQNLLLWGIVGMSWLLGQHYLIASHHQAEKVLGRHLPTVPTVLLVTAFYALVAAVALGWLRGRSAWLGVAGVITYPLYLLHEYIGWTVIDALQHTVSPGVLVVGLTVAMMAAAWLVHRLVERPLAGPMRRGLTAAFAAVRQSAGAGESAAAHPAAAHPAAAGHAAAGHAPQAGHAAKHAAAEPAPQSMVPSAPLAAPVS
jgi:peptidoglycan/LPS O-acetylase OafA/YrhL